MPSWPTAVAASAAAATVGAAATMRERKDVTRRCPSERLCFVVVCVTCVTCRVGKVNSRLLLPAATEEEKK
jgi:hypothetical protein